MKLSCIAVDDEPLALDLLVDNISRIPFLELRKRCSNVQEALVALNEQAIDLIYLDIQMPGLTGIQFLKSLTNPPQIIFITAYKHYAIEGFDLNVTDYLLKPVAFERFLQSANKAKEEKEKRNWQPAVPEKSPTHFFVNADYHLVKIHIPNILFVEGLKDYVKIYLSDRDRPIITRMTMKNIEQLLPVNDFLRVHKSFIICLDHIQSIRKNRIQIGKHEVAISDNNREELFQRLGGITPLL